jgi:hypothetical protein
LPAGGCYAPAAQQQTAPAEKVSDDLVAAREREEKHERI